MESDPVQIEGVVKAFGGRRALDAVSLHLRDGEILGLLGPNGAGKSTLVRTIMGRVAPDAGQVRIFGRPAAAGDNTARERVGFVPQEIAVYPLLTPRENLLVFGRYYGLSGAALEQAITTALGWAALADRAREPTKTLSGGMKRRLNIAAGVLHDPRVVLLDEPTVGVDPQSRERIYDMIASLRSRGVSLIYTTHYMEEAERLCDRIAVIDHGKVIATGTKDELVRATLGGQRQIVIDCDRMPPEALKKELEASGARVDGHRITLFAEHGAEEMLRIARSVEAHGTAVSDMAMKTPTLESVFLHLTGRELRE
ncbi:MAG: Daunorubicin/doxorubicin resistance ATP-binding protein DrrA [Acidobacteria bacterium]|nr:Daunorubicin/doxorubicin resistance ATP-binding protein DrrA [Acidobacteriota bacterium]